MKISEFLSHGSGNGVELRDLVRMTGLSEREVRQSIQRDRLAGVPILSDNINGYFLPGDEHDVSRCARSLRHRAAEINRVADAIERTAVQ